jgi:hypothetical protein
MNRESDRQPRTGSKDEDHQCHTEDGGRRLEIAPVKGSSTGVKQNQIPDSDSSRRNSPRKELPSGRQGSAGKILEALKLIEQKHLSYVKAHQSRLVSRLDESKEQEDDFRKAVQNLEGQILQLISAVENEELE